jgi:flagellar hook-associated protein 2
MESFIDKYIEANGVLQARTQGLTKTIDVINQQRVVLERHLEKLEKKLMTQFNAMDRSVANLKSISTYLSQQLDSLVEPLSFRK